MCCLTLYLQLATHLAETLNESHYNEPPDAHICSYGHQQPKYRVDQHTHAQEVDVSIALREDAKRNLSYHIAVEEWTQYVALNISLPYKFTVIFRTRRSILNTKSIQVVCLIIFNYTNLLTDGSTLPHSVSMASSWPSPCPPIAVWFTIATIATDMLVRIT